MGAVAGRRGALVVAWMCAIGVACAKPYDPFRIPAERLRQRVETLVLPPLVADPDVVDVERIRSLVEPRVVAMLTEGGFEVVPPEEWSRRWLVIAREVGEIWEPVTGRRDDERYEAALAALRHELAVERGVDAVVRLQLDIVPVEGSGRSPLLCGAQRGVYWAGGKLPWNARVTLAQGLCLQANVYDMDERMIYGIRHGIEFVETYALQTHASRPSDQRLRDLERIEEALGEVVGPLATRGRR